MSNRKHSSFSSWKNLFHHHNSAVAPQSSPSDVDHFTWQVAGNMSSDILSAFGNVLSYSKEFSTQTDFKNACYTWLINNPVVKFNEEENIASFRHFNFNEDAGGDKRLTENIEIFRTVENQLVCSMPECMPQSLSQSIKGIIVNIATISYDIWLKKVIHQHRMEHMIRRDGNAENRNHFLLPVQTGEHILTLTVATYSYWSVQNGWLCVKPGKQWKPAFIAGSTYN